MVAGILASLGYPERTTAPGLDRPLRLSARLLIRAGDPGKALEHASAALAVSRRLARNERGSADVGEAELIRAQACVAMGRPADARADAGLAVDALRAGFGPDHPTTRVAVELLATVQADSRE